MKGRGCRKKKYGSPVHVLTRRSRCSPIRNTGEPEILYLGIDQHSKQITVCIRNENGETVLRRQVSTRPEKIEAFFDELVQRDASIMAIVEVCGFHDWLLGKLEHLQCHDIVLIHPDKTTKKKTDRRDANKLCELLWVNRQRLRAAGGASCEQPPQLSLEPVSQLD